MSSSKQSETIHCYMNALYTSQKIEEYAGNPMIEALPPIFETEEDVIDALCYYPFISEDEKKLSPRLKAHILWRIKDFLQPLPAHIRLESMVSTLIRNSYKSRNPIDISYRRKIQKLYGLKDASGITVEDLEKSYQENGTTAECLFINGVSGAGKTTAVNKVLNMYPQVIRHNSYNNEPLIRTQIVWLKVDCPHDGSFATLCRSVFKELDRLTGERWLEKYGYLSRSTSTMLMHLTILLINYNVGVLVIDEIQHLSKLKNESEDMLDFLVTLTNMFSVPMIFIGTSKARRLFQHSFRLARRVQSGGYLEMEPLKKGSMEWDTLVDSLWEFNVLDDKSPLDEKMRDTFFDLSQGVISLTVMLFMCAQSSALLRQMRTITVQLLKEVAENDLSCMKPMIAALRSGDPLKIAEFDDISIDEKMIWNNYQHDIEMETRVNDALTAKRQELKEKRHSVEDSLYFKISGSGLFPNVNNRVLREIIEDAVQKSDSKVEEEDLVSMIMERLFSEIKRVHGRNTEKASNKDGLLKVYQKAISDKIHPYDSFLKSGYIKHPKNDFMEAK